jgi:hypothetical protein
MMMEACMAHAK